MFLNHVQARSQNFLWGSASGQWKYKLLGVGQGNGPLENLRKRGFLGLHLALFHGGEEVIKGHQQSIDLLECNSI